MPKGYVPRYAPGEVLVQLMDEVSSEEFAKGFGAILGYEFIGENDIAYIYRVPEGQEDTAVRRFERHRRVVNWAERRDLKQKERSELIEDLEKKCNEALCSCESDDPDDVFNAALERIADRIAEYVKKS
jgi:hypothetical protein